MTGRKFLWVNGFPFFRQTGLTLIEIMIALVLGVFIVAGVTQVFLNAKQTYRVQEALSRLQENGRFALDFIGKSIRMADYRNCPTDRKVSLYTMAGGSPTKIQGTAAIYGTDGVGTAPDTLSLVWTTKACGTATPTFQDNYSVVTSLGMPTLTRTNASLVEGVENLQVLYGVDTDANDFSRAPNYYVPISNINLPPSTATPNLDQITSIRVSLLLRSLDNNVAAKPLPYVFDGKPIMPPADDRYIRRVFTSTFAVRNRLP